MDTIEDYRRVRFEEYAWAAGFGLVMLLCGYKLYQNIHNEITFPTIMYCISAVGSGLLASSSFEQGKVMSRKVNELERKLKNFSEKV